MATYATIRAGNAANPGKTVRPVYRIKGETEEQFIERIKSMNESATPDTVYIGLKAEDKVYVTASVLSEIKQRIFSNDKEAADAAMGMGKELKSIKIEKNQSVDDAIKEEVSTDLNSGEATKWFYVLDTNIGNKPTVLSTTNPGPSGITTVGNQAMRNQDSKATSKDEAIKNVSDKSDDNISIVQTSKGAIIESDSVRENPAKSIDLIGVPEVQNEIPKVIPRSIGTSELPPEIPVARAANLLFNEIKPGVSTTMQVFYNKMGNEVAVYPDQNFFPDYVNLPEYYVALIQVVNKLIDRYFRPVQAPDMLSLGNYTQNVPDPSSFGYNYLADATKVESCIDATTRSDFFGLVQNASVNQNTYDTARTRALQGDAPTENDIRKLPVTCMMFRWERDLYRLLQAALEETSVDVNDFISFLQLMNNDYFRYMSLHSFFDRNLTYLLMFLPTNLNSITAGANYYPELAKILVQECLDLVKSSITFKGVPAERVRALIETIIGNIVVNVDDFTEIPNTISSSTGKGMIDSILLTSLCGRFVDPKIVIPKMFSLQYLYSFPIFLTIYPRNMINANSLRYATNAYLAMLFRNARRQIRVRVFGPNNHDRVNMDNAESDLDFTDWIVQNEDNRPLSDLLNHEAIIQGYGEHFRQLPQEATRFVNNIRGPNLCGTVIDRDPPQDERIPVFRVYTAYCAWLDLNIENLNRFYDVQGRRRIYKLTSVLLDKYEIYRRMLRNINTFCEVMGYYSFCYPGDVNADNRQINSLTPISLRPSDAMSMVFSISWDDVLISVPTPEFIINGFRKNFEFDQFLINLRLTSLVLKGDPQHRDVLRGINISTKKIFTAVSKITPNTTGIITKFMDRYSVDLLSSILDLNRLTEHLNEGISNAYAHTMNTITQGIQNGSLSIAPGYVYTRNNALSIRDRRWTSFIPALPVRLPRNQVFNDHFAIDTAKHDGNLLERMRAIRAGEIDLIYFNLPVKLKFTNYDDVCPLGENYKNIVGWDFTPQLFVHKGITLIWSFLHRQKSTNTIEFINEQTINYAAIGNTLVPRRVADLSVYMQSIDVYDKRCELFDVNKHIKVEQVEHGYAFPSM